MGRLHVVIVHFPIALALGAALAEVLWLAFRREVFRHAGLFCVVLGAISAVPVVVTGAMRMDAKEGSYVGEYAQIAERHETAGYTTLALLMAAAGVRVASVRWPRRALSVAYGVLLVALVVSVTLTGHFGGQLVHGKDYLKPLL